MGIPSRPSRLIPLALIGSLALAECDVVLGLGGAGAIRAQSQGSMNLRLRRGSEGMELVIEGVGDQPVLQQRMNGQVWEGSLRTQGAPGVRNGRVRLTDPVTGIESATLVGSGSSYALKVTPSAGRPLQDPVVSADGRDLILKFPGLVAAPTLQTGRLNLNTPGRVPQTQYAPPLRPRAVAPPLGDMAVGTMVMQNRSYVNVSGPPVTLTLNNAPAKDALMALARLGGYGFVFVGGESGGATQQASAGQQQTAKRLVSLAFLNEEFGRAFNSVLLASGLKGRLNGNSLFVGKTVTGASFSPQVSKVYRLNQISADSAAQYLASLGARVCTPTTTTFNTTNSATQGTASSSATQSDTKSTSQKTEISCYGGGAKESDSVSGPLFGLEGTTDGRLSTVTLVGESRQIAIAEKYLKNLDLRKRQVAVKVQILNIDLLNDKTVDTSFSAQIGNTFLVSQRGRAFVNFGSQKPGNSAGTGVLGNGTAYSTPGSYRAGVPRVQSQAVGALANNVFTPQVEAQNVVAPQVGAQDVRAPFVPGQVVESSPGAAPIIYPKFDENGLPTYFSDPNPNASQQLVPRFDGNGQTVYIPSTDPSASNVFLPRVDANGQPVYVNSSDPTAAQVLRPRLDANGRQVFVPDNSLSPETTFAPRYDENGRPIYVSGKDPREYKQPQDSFLAYVEAMIESRNTKTLASPTLLVQEGNSASVRTGTSVITDVDETVSEGGVRSFSTKRANAGLSLNLNVAKIDDNGFITLSVNPEVSVPEVAGTSTDGVIFYNITSRFLDSGSIRLRDRQTLVLTGVIQDKDREVVRKWPILGDLPLIGQMFRATSSTRQKQELVILVTPSIVDDDQGGTYGYGYRPSTREARQLMGTR
ncbi:type II and III secretion system protein [Synechococcus sp. AH-551-N17]|nr:type II and III secretion system protein [Synechococcus sp. AH-551-N17]